MTKHIKQNRNDLLVEREPRKLVCFVVIAVLIVFCLFVHCSFSTLFGTPKWKLLIDHDFFNVYTCTLLADQPIDHESNASFSFLSLPLSKDVLMQDYHYNPLTRMICYSVFRCNTFCNWWKYGSNFSCSSSLFCPSNK